MSEPITNDLRDDIKEIKEVISLMAQRLDLMESQILNLYKERDNSFKVHEVQYERMMMVMERLIIVEQKVFPKMWPLISRVERVVGNFDDVHTTNPLDRRKEKKT